MSFIYSLTHLPLLTDLPQIRARDTRLGGWLKPVVGVCQIDLTTKIPWCEDTYIAPATDIFYQPELDRGGIAGEFCCACLTYFGTVFAVLSWLRQSVYSFFFNFIAVVIAHYGRQLLHPPHSHSPHSNFTCTFLPPSLTGVGAMVDPHDDELARKEMQRLAEASEDDFIVMPEPMTVDSYIQQKMATEDTGEWRL